MDMKWTYLLAVIIYGVLVLIKIINKKINHDFIKALEAPPIKFVGFKKDFYSSIAMICIVVSIGINLASVLTTHPINWDSIMVTILVIGMAFISGMTNIYVGNDNTVCIGGYIFKKGDIASIHLKNKKGNSQEIIFKEDIGGFQLGDLEKPPFF